MFRWFFFLRKSNFPIATDIPLSCSQFCSQKYSVMKNINYTFILLLSAFFTIRASAAGDPTGISADSSRIGEENNGAIKGKVTTAEGQPAAFVTVEVKGFRRHTTLTDED